MKKINKLITYVFIAAIVALQNPLSAKRPRHLSKKAERKIIKLVIKHFYQKEKMGWLKTALWFAAPIIFQCIMQEGLVHFLNLPNKQALELERIKDLISINRMLGKELQDLKKQQCISNSLIKDMEKKHTAATIKIMDLQNHYLNTYEKNQGNNET